MRTWLQSQSSSSATIIGSEVFTPWPISGFFDTMVTSPSGAIETKAESSAGAVAPSAAPSARAGSGMMALSARPPPASSDALSTVRRVRSVPECSGDTTALLLQAGGHPDRAADPVVAGTAADVARHGCIDLLVRRPLRAAEQRAGRHDLAGLTIAALHHVDLQPGLLQACADRGAADVLDRVNLRLTDAPDGQLAGALRRAVHVHGTGATQPFSAAELGPHEPELPAQHPQERHICGRLDHAGLAVDIESILHSCHPGASRRAIYRLRAGGPKRACGVSGASFVPGAAS